MKLSCIYKILQKLTTVESKIKEKWEKELSINISEEAWRKSLKEKNHTVKTFERV